ncbi:nicotinate-nucleotide--dimethylbenzimidazole phosphoribosyltransferase [Flavihumibacter stibioxidans]|uniref:Nicotinate-nucleotide--dimethylbenzimidazole phosphoribosyltransferase n=1 Tax=Flavihumibacter stibioxidans TaxID=1834163 RepID=A0ABR7M8N3_9BACT|nr:nicotinate-nucleotide--dimethylbenzimidazole phosphoribosyltransferase [Flavihumibacter stibioxidans]MBC6490973.1 nicotinate-nucleotide--dimethylbenzimidazole phosphoribosyltransferase [Flavihumibacter stibioxidans]
MKDLFFELQEKINSKTKPLGALGQLEETALQVGSIQGSTRPEVKLPHLVVFAGDHGIAETGLVNPYPQAVTAQMVHNFIRGGAAINVFCRQHQITLKIADAGVKADLSELHGSPEFIHAKIAPGTRNYLEEPAMSFEETERAIAVGRVIVNNIAATGCNTIAFGEMGIGNSSAASLLMAAFLNLPLEKCVGRGTGADDIQLTRKLQTLQAVSDKHLSVISLRSPLKTLQYLGGYEIAMMVGAYLSAAEHKMTIVVDGFIASAALLVAQSLRPEVLDNCIFGHCSGELGHHHLLHHFGARPLLNLGMRLGEGTGAALAIPLVQSAVLFLNEMAEMDSLKIPG